MALIKCTGCGHMISDRAMKCPKCGTPIVKAEAVFTTDKEVNAKVERPKVEPVSHVGEYKKEQNQKGWLWVLPVLLLCLIGGGYWWYSQNMGGNHEVNSFMEKFAKAIETNDRPAILAMYPDAKKADAFMSFNPKDISVKKTDDYWNVSLGDDQRVIVVRKKQNNTLYVKESYGIFTYPESKLKLAKNTGCYDPKLNDVKNAERLSDEAFISWLGNKATKKLTNKVQITKNISERGSDRLSSDVPIDSGDTFCTVEISNQTNHDIDGDAYRIEAKETWDECSNWDTPDMSVNRIKQSGEKKTLTGKPIPANGTATYTWTGAGYMGSAHNWTENHQVEAEIIFSPQLEKYALASYEPSGNEYAEYLSMKSTGDRAKSNQ